MEIHTDQGSLRRIGRNLPWLVLAILALAAILRMSGLASQSLWLDEVYQVRASSNNLVAIVQICINVDTHPPLYYLLQHFWMLLFGQSEVAVRSLSACLGIVSVLLVYMVGRELFDRRTGLTTSFLLAISLLAIAVSQEGRPYSLLMLLTVLSFLFFVKLLKADRPTKTLAFLYILANVFLCYTHIYGLFTLGSQVLYFLLFRRRYAKAQSVLWASYVAILIGFSPWIFVLVTSVFGQGIHSLDWIPKPSFNSVLATLQEMAGGNGLIFLLFLFLSAVGVFQLTVTQKRRALGKRVQTTRAINARISVTEPRMVLLLIWFFVPLVLSLVISFAIRPIFWDRYFVGIVPALCLLVARGVENISLIVSTYAERLKVSTAGIMVVALIALLALPNLYNYYTIPQKEQWREVASLIESETKPSDAIVIYPDGYRTPFDYYYKGDPEMIVLSQDVIGNTDAISGKDRIWLVLMTYTASRDAPIKKELFIRYGNDSLVLQKEFFEIAVYLFDISKE